ncbi:MULTISPECIES: DUF2917 domain-containing protein [Deefgea]|uniref:DUF2917 domain-containing protein n=1 Tax=Deefgea chitinilytica TaxID=570276 RepID=A0ABS2CEB9_9NEIS|nr:MULTISPECIES: DUF2917 domain-containing protein [Deefgea]MBM5572492.1 DUF2917 domain-containing protein [Deefgea chitinilytica]MBM9889728.1 DUF2917 domain-containing protein [Deefgea sp. CFH1-16]
MVTYLRLNVAAGELLVVELSHPAQLWCEAGGVWVTHEHSTEDIQLYRGEHRQLAVGKVLVEGVGQLCFCGENLQITPASRGSLRTDLDPAFA